MKKLVVLLSLIIFSSCGSYTLSTLNHTPRPSYQIKYDLLRTAPYYRNYWNFPNNHWYTPYYVPTKVVVVKPKVRVESKGRRSGENRNYKKKND